MSEKKSLLGRWVAITAIAASVVAILTFLGVNPPNWWQREPILVTLVGVTPEFTESINVDFKVDEVHAKHETFGESTESFSLRFKASPDYKIVSYSWIQGSATRVSNLVFNIDGGGESIVASFGLTSGPALDRYRGWVKGTIRTTQTKVVPESLTPLAKGVDIRMQEIDLPDGNYGQFGEIRILDSEGNNVATLFDGRPSEIPLLARVLELKRGENNRYKLVSGKK